MLKTCLETFKILNQIERQQLQRAQVNEVGRVLSSGDAGQLLRALKKVLTSREPAPPNPGSGSGSRRSTSLCTAISAKVAIAATGAMIAAFLYSLLCPVEATRSHEKEKVLVLSLTRQFSVLSRIRLFYPKQGKET